MRHVTQEIWNLESGIRIDMPGSTAAVGAPGIIPVTRLLELC